MWGFPKHWICCWWNLIFLCFARALFVVGFRLIFLFCLSLVLAFLLFLWKVFHYFLLSIFVQAFNQVKADFFPLVFCEIDHFSQGFWIKRPVGWLNRIAQSNRLAETCSGRCFFIIINSKTARMVSENLCSGCNDFGKLPDVTESICIENTRTIAKSISPCRMTMNVQKDHNFVFVNL